jgi:hypothetical protein
MKNTKSEVSQQNANEVSKQGFGKEEIIIRENIAETPFQIITVKDESFGVMGEYRVTEQLSSAKKVKEELKKITWNRIVQVMMIMKNIDEKITNKIEKE